MRARTGGGKIKSAFQWEVNSSLAHSRSALKRIRQAEKRRLRNRAARSAVRTAVRRFREALAAKDDASIEQCYRTAVKTLDRAAARGYIHPNAAARHKSRLSCIRGGLNQADQA